MELIERYIYAVAKRLPMKQRADIERELRSIIEDMMEQDQESSSQEDKVKAALLELGDPKLLANNYRENKRYLIGPQNFENYLLVLKIVLGAVFIGISAATLVGSIFSEEVNVVQTIIAYFGSVFSAMLQAFVWVTLGFGISEYYGAKATSSDKDDWSIAELPPIPEKKAIIPRSEPIMAIVFITIFIVIFWSSLHLVAAYFHTQQAGWVIIPVFNVEVFRSYGLLVVGIFMAGILKEILKLVSGRWTLRLSLLVAAITGVSLVLSIILFSNPDIWNVNFIPELNKHTDISIVGIGNTSIVILILVGYLIEIATTLYKGFKYNF